VWADLDSYGVRPDGICLDTEGTIWVTNPTAPEVIRVAEGGRLLDRLTTTQPSFACMLGARDRKTLFVLTAPDSGTSRLTASDGAIEVAAVNVPGAGLP
jgi:sugar lactone lactonase YvrE